MPTPQENGSLCDSAPFKLDCSQTSGLLLTKFAHLLKVSMEPDKSNVFHPLLLEGLCLKVFFVKMKLLHAHVHWHWAAP